MNAVLSVPTIFICTAITFLMVAVALTLLAVHDKKEKATRWWAAAMWMGVLAVGVAASRTVAPAWFAIGIGNVFVIMTMSLVSAGFTVFSGGRPRLWLLFTGPLIWAGCYVGSEVFREEITYRIVVLTSVMATYSVMIVRTAWQGWQTERLPTFLATVVIYGAHGVVFAARIVAGVLYPATESDGAIQAPWLVAFALEGFALTVLSAFVFTMLIKERAERRYRLAAEIDGLTSAATRRFFVSETRDLMARKQAKGVLAVIDLDHFKSINDSFGHMGGDRVLQTFGAFVTQRLEPGMVFGRLGGEEFGIFVPDVTDRQAGEFFEAIRTGVEAMEIPFMGNPIRITISLGVASIRDAGQDFDHLMAAADSALYIAKDEGRNRLRFFSLAMRMHRIIEDGQESRVGLAESRLSRTGVRMQVKRA
ncbi:MAG: hypothetical protein JWL86_3092 [Rhizobium sp.]|nr:hypothetical protein [Rhizobium sp.]